MGSDQETTCDCWIVLVFRTTPPNLLEGVCDYYDKVMRKLFEKAIIGKDLSDEEWEMAQLPAPVG